MGGYIRDDPTLFTKAAKMYGIKNIKGGNNLEILPYALGSEKGSISDYEMPILN